MLIGSEQKSRQLPFASDHLGSRVLIGGRHQNRICKIVFKGGFGAENRAPGQDRIFFAPNSLALTAHSSNSTGELQIIASEVEIKSPPWAGLGTLRERCPRPGAGNPRRV